MGSGGGAETQRQTPPAPPPAASLPRHRRPPPAAAAGLGPFPGRPGGRQRGHSGKPAWAQRLITYAIISLPPLLAQPPPKWL